MFDKGVDLDLRNEPQGASGRQLVLDPRHVTLVGQDAIAFLARCEADNITLKNCAANVREWITRQRESS
jgi:hypothetical protein